MKLRSILTILISLLSFTANATPARKGIIPLTQPDGTTFNAVFKGDEFGHIKATSDGHAIIQGFDGWWHYAVYDKEGKKCDTGWRVGLDTPEDILTRSKSIPYELLSREASARRRKVSHDMLPSFREIMISTRSGDMKKRHGLVILAQFKDLSFTHSKNDFIDLLTKKGYSKNGATGSAKEYFDAQFKGLVEFEFDVSDIITLSGDVADYGANDDDGNDKNPAQMIIEACKAADGAIDFSMYDDDGNGEIDNVFVFFAGEDEAEGADETRIWSHAWYVYNGAGFSIELDGKRLNRYACSSELTRMSGGANKLAGIGTFCHEYSHTFGLPDFYDTDYEGSGGETAGLWHKTSLMDAGNQNNKGNTPPYFNALEREQLGLSVPVVIDSDGTYRLEPVHKSGQSYRIETDNENEYFLIECRSGKEWDAYTGGNGMLIYHIDMSDRNSGFSELYGEDISAGRRWFTNEVNCRPDHQCADLLEADGRKDTFTEEEGGLNGSLISGIGGIYFPYGKVNSITPESKPGLTYWSGDICKASITNIRKDGDDIVFSVIGFSEESTPPVPVNISHESFADAAIIRFESDRPFEEEAVVIWRRPGKAEESKTVLPYEPGKYAVVLEGLEPGNKTYTVDIAFKVGEVIGESNSISFMTKKVPAVTWPYIYMGSIVKDSEGRIPYGTGLPLRVYNATDAAEIVWTFNDKPVNAFEKGYFHVYENGTLKAHITFEDGSQTVIMKEIFIGEENKK